MINNTQEKDENRVRPARYAGSWYEADPSMLEKQLDGFLKKAKVSPINLSYPERVQALVVPHAAYFFSGEAAAHAYSAVIEKKVHRIFLLGPSHHVGFHGVALTRAAFFETPFGKMRVEQSIVATLQRQSLFCEQEEAHEVEHSLEMQLPFLKKLFKDVPLVPLVVGTLEGEAEVRAVAATLKHVLSEDDLIIVSSDFTHYGPRFGYVPFQENIRENIKQLDMQAYHFLKQGDLSGFLQFQKETQDTICGLYPLAILLALLPPKKQVSLRAYRTSQEMLATDPDHSVSYLAITFSK